MDRVFSQDAPASRTIETYGIKHGKNEVPRRIQHAGSSSAAMLKHKDGSTQHEMVYNPSAHVHSRVVGNVKRSQKAGSGDRTGRGQQAVTKPERDPSAAALLVSDKSAMAFTANDIYAVEKQPHEHMGSVSVSTRDVTTMDSIHNSDLAFYGGSSYNRSTQDSRLKLVNAGAATSFSTDTDRSNVEMYKPNDNKLLLKGQDVYKDVRAPYPGFAVDGENIGDSIRVFPGDASRLAGPDRKQRYQFDYRGPRIGDRDNGVSVSLMHAHRTTQAKEDTMLGSKDYRGFAGMNNQDYRSGGIQEGSAVNSAEVKAATGEKLTAGTQRMHVGYSDHDPFGLVHTFDRTSIRADQKTDVNAPKSFVAPPGVVGGLGHRDENQDAAYFSMATVTRRPELQWYETSDKTEVWGSVGQPLTAPNAVFNPSLGIPRNPAERKDAEPLQKTLGAVYRPLINAAQSRADPVPQGGVYSERNQDRVGKFEPGVKTMYSSTPPMRNATTTESGLRTRHLPSFSGDSKAFSAYA